MIEELGYGQRHSCDPDEAGRREHRRCQATRVPVEIVRRRTQTLGPDHARNVCVDGIVRVGDVLALQSADVEAWSKWCDGMFMDASRAHCQADATSGTAIELPPEVQVKGEDLIGELLKSLHGTRKRCEREVSDHSSGEGARVDTTGAHRA